MTAEVRAVKTRLVGERNGYQVHETTNGPTAVYATVDGFTIVGGAWGPAADRTDNWFAWRAGTDPLRVESYDAAIAYITTPSAEETTS